MSDTNNPDDVKKYVRERYGKVAKDRIAECCSKSTACCSTPNLDIQIGYEQKDLDRLPKDAVLSLGCGNPTALADIVEGETVVDLGSGGGIDCFLASAMVGQKGKVIGIDMTDEMLELANKNAVQGGYKNVEFRKGEIDNLPVEDNFADLIISNCVINLAPDKKAVFRDVFRVLKPGGRMMVSDLVTNGEIPVEVRKSFEAWASCIAGALVKEDYVDKIKSAGFEKVVIEKEINYAEDTLTDDLKGKILSISVKAYKPSN